MELDLAALSWNGGDYMLQDLWGQQSSDATPTREGLAFSFFVFALRLLLSLCLFARPALLPLFPPPFCRVLCGAGWVPTTRRANRLAD